ncbi:MAG: ornithine decarboxylase [Confluentimicrobium sp.]|uniref:type III PLP-dependent enzyme n=1 Tax=Actibacterium sp. TaxID=1872125 RepID=UPI000C505448|nr:type III PLP-dependent enzyme [Actibacterium sp.]MBC58626.1 ornithine decarboxylase [Actibacterium sp.]
MGLKQNIWATPAEHLRLTRPDHPVIYAAPRRIQSAARRFVDGFPGQVSYAVKANPEAVMVSNLAAAGVWAFDVASPDEMALVRAAVPQAALHYNNPVRSTEEIARAVELGVVSYAVDSFSELDKLMAALPRTAEIAVRFKLPVKGAVYDFGGKFGAPPEKAAALLRRVGAAGFRPSITFHPGTQCNDPRAWATYIAEAARISDKAGVPLARLNVGGGFPSHREGGRAPALGPIFAAIGQAARAAFGPEGPALLCEPGRALAAEGVALATRVKALRDGGDVFLNDGIYGGLAEAPLMGRIDRIAVLDPAGAPRCGAPVERVLFGPTCDSLDRLPGVLRLPGDMAEGDYILFFGMGAYSPATATRFNGYGALEKAVVVGLQP